MKLIRAVVFPAVAVLVAACSTIGDGAVAPSRRRCPPSGPSRERPRSRADAPSWRGRTTRGRRRRWTSYFRPGDLRQLLDDGETFADQLQAVDDLPMLELAGTIATYTEEVELLLRTLEEGGGPNTFEAELARDNVVEQVRVIARTACG